VADLRVVGGDLLPPAQERRHLLSIADLARGDIERLLATARSFAHSQERENKKLPTLRGRLVLNVFYESSTRTSSSFELAAKRLSADTMTLKSTGSSVDKGESLKDTALTLSAYDPDVIVLRHPEVGAAQFVSRLTDARVVNAGDGKHQHPTQARASRSRSSEMSSTHALHARSSRRCASSVRTRSWSGRRRSSRTGSPRRRTTLRRSATRTSSTSCGCSASGCSRERTSFPLCASTRAAGASRLRAYATASESCTPGR
jgi:hypothetical protein